MTDTVSQERARRSRRRPPPKIRVVAMVRQPVKDRLEELAEASDEYLSVYIARVLSRHAGLEP